jgi:MoaA/NifB/PqqE/SkfB family radical SAM enzyme
VPGRLRTLWSLATRRHLHCEVLLTYACNLRCDFCAFWRRPSGGAERPLDVDGFRRVADALAAEGSLVISLEGGEPFLREDLEEVVATFALHHRPMVYTNGTLVTPGRARRLFDAGLWQAAVSIDYADPALHDRRRGAAGTHARALEALDFLKDAAPHGGAQVHAFTVLMRDNADQLEDLVALTAAHGVGHQFTLLSSRSTDRSADAAMPPTSGIGRRLAALGRSHPHLATFDAYLAEVDRWLAHRRVRPCLVGRQGFTIDPRGNVTPCNERLHECAGNVLDAGWPAVKAQLRRIAARAPCNQCCTLCRGFSDVFGRASFGGLLRAVRGLAGRLAQPE